MSEHHLAQLFGSCDRSGKGRIGPREFQELCAEYNISPSDSETIFRDLDRDGKGQVTYDDFAWGFRDFLSPGARRLSMQFARAALDPPGIEPAWNKLVAELGEVLPDKCHLTTSGPQLAALHQEMNRTSVSPATISQLEDAIRGILQDVRLVTENSTKMEDILAKERAAHLAHLKSLEVELDSQVSHVKAQARAEVLAQCETEKKTITSRMKDEMNELETHLKLFHKLNTLLSRNSYQLDHPKDTADDIVFENLELKNTLADTKTNLTLVQSEMAILKSAYEEKCRQLHRHLDNVEEFRSQNDHIHQQLSLLQEVNIKLQDTNDSLLTSDGWQVGRSLEAPILGVTNRKSKSKFRPQFISMSDVELDHISDSSHYKVRRLMEDIDDSGLSMQDSSTQDSRDVSLHGDAIARATTLEVDEMDSVSLGRRDLIAPPDRSFKIVFAGDAAVGKSCFIHRLCKGEYVNNIGSTLGVDYHLKTIRVDGVYVTLQLWDTAGQERFRSLTKSYFRRADGVVLLYDVASERSFQNVRHWIESIEESCTQATKLPVVLCGNKVDLRDASNQGPRVCVDTEQGAKLAREYGAIFLETSSMSGTNLTDAIANLTREMLIMEDLQVESSALIISEEKPNQLKTSACC